MEYDELVDAREEKLVDEWFKRLVKLADQGLLQRFGSEVCRGGMPCTIPPETDWMRGGYNLCIPLLYEDGEKWLARFCISGAVRHGDEKVKREVATMQFILEHTNIPVPRIHMWGPESSNPTGLGAFIVMDFIQGIRLGDVWDRAPSGDGRGGVISPDIPEHDLRRIYQQVSAYLLDLVEKPFQYIGALSIQEGREHSFFTSPFTQKMQEIEAHADVWVGGDRDKIFSKSARYFRYVLDQNWTQLMDQKNAVNDPEDARLKYIALKQMDAALKEFSGPYDDADQFRLYCDDFCPLNMIVKSATDLTIVSVIDWEWSYAAPYQMLASPPRWLAGEKFYNFRSREDVNFYSRLLDIFLDELRQQENLRHTPVQNAHASQLEDQLQQLDLKDQEANGNVVGNDNTHHPTVNSHVEQDHVGKADRSVTSNGHKTSRIPPLSDPRGQRLSALMRENWITGRFWLHDLIQAKDLACDYFPWAQLKEQYPYLENLAKINEDEVNIFVKRKMKDRQEYDRDWAKIRPQHEEWRRKYKEQLQVVKEE
ncbi:hypothetical protein K461DRAFT_277903 [Myriangium duriaei CBS 260.36]|uniref:Aminoglycoside phosphotransferase domain-containing protein n=1 Tax=Myriangium duriaei CBS 260.36 TaxID=1168546 RepID=A0A9P4MHC9_9PEZI|nr:hypothetical protein K461DRAFT_277903 [Myriangium duriaei CBS 260.36]